jgi:parallel beta-helix repeat protein
MGIGMSHAVKAEPDKPLLIDVTATGALPNDGQDDTLAVLAAFDRCKAEKAQGVVFPKGRYEFHEGANPKSPRMSLPMDDVHGVIIDGQGSEFVFHGITGCFSFGRCSDITVKNIQIDWDRPPFSVGTIIATGDGWFEVDVFPEFPVQGGETVQAMMDYEPDTGLPCRHGLDFYCLENPMQTELVRPQVLRVRTAFGHAPITAGKVAVLRHQVYGYNGLTAVHCKNMTFQDVTVHTCPGMGFIGVNSENVTLDRCTVQPKPGTQRLISATADGSHFGGCTGDIILRNCLFDGQGDDAINMKSGLFLNMAQIVDERTVLARHNLNMGSMPDPGDAMELMPQDTLLAYGTVRVQSAAMEPDGHTHRIVLEEPLPKEAKPGDMLANASKLPRARISNCTFQRNRARGMLIQIRDTVVEGCMFKDITSAGVLIIAETVHFYESIPARHVVLRNNTFEHCNYGAAMARGVISIEGITPGWKDAPLPGVFREITIENNRITRSDNAGIFMTGTDTAIIRGNEIVGVCDKPTQDRCAAVLHIESSRNIRIEGNQAEQARQGSGCKTVLELSANNIADTITAAGNTGF